MRELAEAHVLSAAAEYVRVSVFGGRTQLDIALPLDLPIAAFVPELAKLVSSRDVRQDEDVAPREERKTHWVLRRLGSDRPLAPHSTLRDAAIGHGDLLYLSSERTLAAPTLYDDVVDAAARLNRSSYASWNPGAARIMGFTGLFLVAASFVYFLVDLSFRPQWAGVAAISVVMVGMLLAGAAVAFRSYQRIDIASALAWAAIPIAAGTCWTFLHVFGDAGVAWACLAMLVVNYASFRLVGTGHWGFLCSSVIFTLCGLAAAIKAIAGPAPMVTGAVLAVVATLLTLTVPALTASLGQFEAPTADEDHDEENPFENPFNRPAVKHAEKQANSAESIPSAEGVRERVKMAVATRSALFAGLAVSAGAGVAVTLRSADRPGWAPLLLAGVVAGVLGLRARRRPTAVEKASLGIPAIGIVAMACVYAQHARVPMGLVAFGVMLTFGVVAALLGIVFTGGRRIGRLTTGLLYVEYLLVASLIPLGLWVAGAFGHVGNIPR